MSSSRDLSSLFSWEGGRENPQRVLRISKLVPKILLTVIMIGAFFMLSSSVALADTGRSPAEYSNSLVYCTGTQCNQYAAAQTHCIDSFRLLQDDPIYDGAMQVGSLRWWYSDTCNTYWSQVFSTNCTNIDNFVAEVFIRGQGIAAAANFGFDKQSCSLSVNMFYDPNDVLEPGGGIHFTDGRSWIYY